ncbi:transcriptional regulator [Chitinophaga varians]|uniref:transcriptional regulator n=1 Tax=Chitinophaga varians TaxID=2202339 RepID=UPI00165EF732|nr:transcriptional regulator [Chitinophaga varians]MBC9912948.1 transcriptional regulator [Chitinophaga varians]
MENFTIDQDIPVWYVAAASFPDGVPAAWAELHGLLPGATGRQFYGISHPDQTGKITYKAGVAASSPEEGRQYGKSGATVRKGLYAGETLQLGPDAGRQIGEAFQRLLKHPDLDPQGYCLEMYLDQGMVRCMVPLVEK